MVAPVLGWETEGAVGSTPTRGRRKYRQATERRFQMKVSKRVEEFIDVELDSEAVAQLRWVFERSNGGHYHEALEPLAKALGVGHDE